MSTQIRINQSWMSTAELSCVRSRESPGCFSERDPTLVTLVYVHDDVYFRSDQHCIEDVRLDGFSCDGKLS